MSGEQNIFSTGEQLLTPTGVFGLDQDCCDCAIVEVYYKAEKCSCCLNGELHGCSDVYVHESSVTSQDAFFEWNGLCYRVNNTMQTSKSPPSNCIATNKIFFNSCNDCCNYIAPCSISGCGQIWRRGSILLKWEQWAQSRHEDTYNIPNTPCSCSGPWPGIDKGCNKWSNNSANVLIVKTTNYDVFMDHSFIECKFIECIGSGRARYEGRIQANYAGQFPRSLFEEVGSCNNPPWEIRTALCRDTENELVRISIEVFLQGGLVNYDIKWYTPQNQLIQNRILTAPDCVTSIVDQQMLVYDDPAVVATSNIFQCGVQTCRCQSYLSYTTDSLNRPHQWWKDIQLIPQNLACVT